MRAGLGWAFTWVVLAGCGAPSSPGSEASGDDSGADAGFHKNADAAAADVAAADVASADAPADASHDAPLNAGDASLASSDPCCMCLVGSCPVVDQICQADSTCVAAWPAFCACEAQSGDTGHGCVPPIADYIVCAGNCTCFQ
jgi:hypothetical protein